MTNFKLHKTFQPKLQMLQITVTFAQATIVAFKDVSRCKFWIIEATSTCKSLLERKCSSASLEVYSAYL